MRSHELAATPYQAVFTSVIKNGSLQFIQGEPVPVFEAPRSEATFNGQPLHKHRLLEKDPRRLPSPPDIILQNLQRKPLDA